MKLQCQIEVNNRTLKDLNIRSNSKYIKSTLALGKEAKDQTEFFILHFSTVNKSGTKYRVKNIKQVFAKFINEGKSTIRFDEPPHDLCIKSDAVQLKCFMRLLKSCISGDAKALQTAPLTSLSYIAKDNAPTKLVIRDRSEFPSKGLPRTLETLTMSGLKLCNFRRDILLLKRLTVLDLSNNEIEKLPAEFGRLPCLKELYLANNQLGSKEIVDWKWLLEPQIIKTLKLLDLSGNKLKYLPKAIGKLANLITLKLDNNLLDQLPATLGRISTLKYLSISGNNLKILPGSLLQCKLEHIDLSNNSFQRIQDPPSIPKRPAWEFYIGSLVNLAARVVLKHKFYYAPNIIPFTLVEFLDNANICVCGALTVTESTSLNRNYELKSLFRSVTCDSNSSNVPFECFVCSSHCLKRFLMYQDGQERHFILP